MVKYVAAFACIMSADAPCLRQEYSVIIMAAISREPWPDIGGAGADISTAHRPCGLVGYSLDSAGPRKGRKFSSCLQLVGKRTLPILAGTHAGIAIY